MEPVFVLDDNGYLHTTLRGPTWYATNATQEDSEFLTRIMMDHNLMKWYGTGPSPDAPDALARTLDLWLPRFARGEPHGGLIVRLIDTHESVGFVLIGLSGKPSTGSIAYAFVKHVWHTGLATSVIHTMMNTWVPEVVRGEFQVYDGGPLRVIEANVKTANHASFRLLRRHGFDVVDTIGNALKLRHQVA